MNGLRPFMRFALSEFLEKKVLTVISCEPLSEYGSNTVIGTKVTAAITLDNTDYGKPITNLYEKLTIKVSTIGLEIPQGAEIKLLNGVASVYGERQNMLSIKAENVQIVNKK